MTQPRNATTTEEGRSYLWPPTGETFVSVTTVIGGGIPKHFLAAWAAKRAGEFVLSHMTVIQDLRAVHQGKDPRKRRRGDI